MLYTKDESLVPEADFYYALSNHLGWCTTCNDFTHKTCEPNAYRYVCPICNKFTVFGAKEALLREFFDVVEDG